ncbi:MAG: hypothetical protein KGI57_02520 [Hyphomicrobiales bacterium]|nr:hypothetical protein [Hyphomicrobiales bacterium]MDE2016559.1 hypothetical protein [Hyphomicrobiales bacterium]
MSLPEPRPYRPATSPSPRTAAACAVAWLVVLGKPTYPLYVWLLTGRFWIAVPSALTAPLYAALAALARRDGRWVRWGVPALALVDSLAAAKLLGEGAGTEAFLVPAALLVAVAIPAAEAKAARALAALLAGAFLAAHGRYGAPLAGWSAAEAGKLLTMNAASAAGLSALVLWRFAGLARD